MPLLHISQNEEMSLTIFYPPRAIILHLNRINQLEYLMNYNGYKLLLVEDDSTSAMVTEEILTSWGFDVDIAENGVICIEMVQEQKYDFIFMDCTMPLMDGYDTTREIRTLEIEGVVERCPIVALTGNTEEGAREKCLASGMDDYFPKPVTSEALEKAVKEHLETQSLEGRVS